MMNDLLSEFEQQFGVITAEITTKTCSLLNNKELSEASGARLIKDVKNLLLDAVELLVHMELEVRDSPQDQREKLRHRVKSYEVELKRLEGEFNRAKKSALPNEESMRVELFGDENFNEDDQKQRLLNNTETLERTSMRLAQSYKAAIDSEQVGAQVLSDLQHQRETLTRARERLHDTDEDLNQSSRVLNSMRQRFSQNKCILSCIFAFVIIVIVVAIYVKIS